MPAPWGEGKRRRISCGEWHAVQDGILCGQCHVEVTPALERACETISAPVDCSTCHAERVREHSFGMHGTLAAAGDPNAPTCLDCHEKHATSDHLLPTSPRQSDR